MFDPDPTDLAVRGERGIDLFLRLGDVAQQRSRYRCIATALDEGGEARLVDFEPHAKRDTARLLSRARDAMGDRFMTQPMVLGDATSWPSARDAADPVALFLHLDFFRAWQVADMALQRLMAQLQADPDALPRDPARVAGSILPLFDFNRLTAGCRLAALIEPVLRRRIAAPGFRDDGSGSAGYALRMLGDLCLRAEDYSQALACFSTAIGAGDNPFRRRKAIEAAHLAGDGAALQDHLAAYRAQWDLPGDLATYAEAGA
ncbi:hypothetical protein [Pararhodobacter oceanensis]|uniref:hypothetical protein n=1 Tax=Pararhodobacter oceanensis TaxID=2172121 RepID=UPI003A953CBC